MTDSEVPYSPGQRAQWSSETAFVFSMTAATVGLGNLWRFPYMVGENGGGAFIVAYLIALVLVALPTMMMEVGIGRLVQGSVVGTFRTVKRFGNLYGWFVVMLTIAITSYYLVITGWTMGYAVSAFCMAVQPFDDFTGGYNSLWYFFAVTVLATAVLIRGVSAIEKLSKILMPVLVLMIIGIVISAARMDGWEEARSFMFVADYSHLKSPTIWLFAFGQAFYTLAIGQGYLITYGSYIPQQTNIPRACLIVTGTETSIALLAGFMIFPFVFTYGFDPGAGSQLAFETLPRVFDEMEHGGWLAMGFFSLFFAAAFSSCLAGLKVIIAAFSEEFRMGNLRSVLAVGCLMIFLGVPSALSFSPVNLQVMGMPFLDFMDQFGGTNMVVASGIMGAGLVCWFVPRPRIAQALGAKSRWWEFKIYVIGRSLPLLAAFFILWNIL